MHIPGTLPRMILFDYGNTLLYEPRWDPLRGEEALFRYIKSNKNGHTPQGVTDFSQELFEQLSAVRRLGFELHEWQFQRLLYESLEIELSIPLEQAEKVFWENASPGAVMPGAQRMLEYIHSRGIRSGVISNISFSGAALRERINRLLPGNRFEFILASSEYILRKPSRLLFELALKKAGLTASQAWFCGDNVVADVEGSAGVGIFPVWYEEGTVENPWREKPAREPACQCLHITDWEELIGVLEELPRRNRYP